MQGTATRDWLAQQGADMDLLDPNAYWREVEYFEPVKKGRRKVRDANVALFFEGVHKQVLATHRIAERIRIRDVGHEVWLETDVPDASSAARAIVSAIQHYRSAKAVRQAFTWSQGPWIHILAIVDPWRRESRRSTYAAEMRIRAANPDCDLFFEARPVGGVADLPRDARLIFAREPVAVVAAT